MSRIFTTVVVLTSALSVFGLSEGFSIQSNQANAGNPSATQRKITEEELWVLSLRTLNTAQASYWGGDAKKGYAPTLKQLGPEGEDIIDAHLASGRHDGYDFVLKAERGQGGIVSHYQIIARPLKSSARGQRNFFTDESGVIRWTGKNRPATRSDPPIE